MDSYALFASYVFLTTFTPGPNNVTATAAGSSLGYRKALPYLAGMAAGFFLDMRVTGLVNAFLSSAYGLFSSVIKWFGFAYLLYLAASPFLPHRTARAAPATYNFVAGLALQLVNPKVILYGITIFGMFSSIVLKSPATVLVSSLGLSLAGFCSVSLWCLAGVFLSRFLTNRRNNQIFNAVLGLFLVYTAVSLVLH